MSLSHLIKAAGVSVDMIDRRDLVKRLYGDRYDSYVETPKVLIRAYGKKHGLGTLASALAIATDAIAKGHGSVLSPLLST